MKNGVRNFLREADAGFNRNKSLGDNCPIDMVKPYEISFREVMRGTTLQEEMDARKDEGKTTHVLDLFGSGHFIKSMENIDSLTGTRILAKKPAHLEAANDYEIITENLFTKKAWQKIKERANQVTVNGFDLIVCRPVGPKRLGARNEHIDKESFRVVWGTLLQRSISLLSPTGTLYAEVPPTVALTDNEKINYADQMQVQGYEVSFGTQYDSARNKSDVLRITSCLEQ